MPANTDPIYSKNGNFGFVRLTAANTSSAGDGTIGTSIFKICTVDATNGSIPKFIQFSPTASVQNTAVASVTARLFISSVSSGATTNADTWLWYEIFLPAVTGASSTAANSMPIVPVNFPIKAGYSILATVHAAPNANTAWVAGAIYGDY